MTWSIVNYACEEIFHLIL